MTTTDYDLNACQMMELHIGRMNVFAISGGRVHRIGPTTLSFPVSNGYSVETEYLKGRDLYAVRRVYTRGLKRFVKGEIRDVYATELGEFAYKASCFADGEFGEVLA